MPFNLGTAKFNNTNKSINTLVEQLVKNGMARIVDSNSNDCAMPPRPFINGDLEYIEKPEARTDAINRINVMSLLNSIDFYIGGKTPSLNYTTPLQMPYPIYTKMKLKYNDVTKIIEECESSLSSCTYRIILSEIEDDLIVFAKKMVNIKNSISFYMLFSREIISIKDFLMSLGYEVIVLRDPQIPFTLFLSDSRFQTNSMFIIRCINDLQVFHDMNIRDTRMDPVVVADKNLDFYKDYVFITEEELLQSTPSKQLIFLHQKINLNNWGRLYIHPNGQIYSSSEGKISIGEVGLPIAKVISKELYNNYAWRKIRDNKICEDCVFQWLCPSPSVQERILGVETICNKHNRYDYGINV